MGNRHNIRVFLLTILVLAGFATLLARLYEFQIEKRDHYLSLVPGDTEITVREPGIRGAILDRHGVELARNQRIYEIYFDLEEIYKAYTRTYEAKAERQLIDDRDDIPRPKRQTDIVKIVNTMIIPTLKELGVAKNYSASAMRTHFVTHRGLVPFSYHRGLTYDQFARLAEHSIEVPGVYLGIRPHREYPYQALASHLIGYTNPWEKGDIPKNQRQKYDHYVGDEKGVIGIEATFDDILRGPEGSRTLVRNDRGKITGIIDYRPPNVGADVRLTIDARAQNLVSNVLRRAGRASAVVMDVRSGEIIAMASVPDYNPNDFIPSISREKWTAYQADTTSPLTNRAIAGFAPGSTLKLATAVAGALHQKANQSHRCIGYVSYGSYQPRCWKRSGHGTLSMSEAIQRSCNPYFFKLANSLGGQRMITSLTMLGFGQKTNIQLPNESPGVFPGSPHANRLARNARLTPATLAQLSIGQGGTLTTPLQICAMTAGIANGGRYYQPRLVKSAVLPNGTVLVEDRPNLRLDLVKEGIVPAHLEIIRRGMWRAANEPSGTARRAAIPNVEIAAKTGTAQTTDNGQPSHNAWTVAFAPYDEPRYAVAVMVQNGKSGGAVCGPLVHLILRGLLARDEGMKLPLTKLDPVVGNRDPIEQIELPENIMAMIEIGSAGETGDEAVGGTTVQPAVTISVDESITPEPTITPEIDEEGSVIPRAIPVEEP